MARERTWLARMVVRHFQLFPALWTMRTGEIARIFGAHPKRVPMYLGRAVELGWLTRRRAPRNGRCAQSLYGLGGDAPDFRNFRPWDKKKGPDVTRNDRAPRACFRCGGSTSTPAGAPAAPHVSGFTPTVETLP